FSSKPQSRAFVDWTTKGPFRAYIDLARQVVIGAFPRDERFLVGIAPNGCPVVAATTIVNPSRTPAVIGSSVWTGSETFAHGTCRVVHHALFAVLTWHEPQAIGLAIAAHRDVTLALASFSDARTPR